MSIHKRVLSKYLRDRGITSALLLTIEQLEEVQRIVRQEILDEIVGLERTLEDKITALRAAHELRVERLRKQLPQ